MARGARSGAVMLLLLGLGGVAWSDDAAASADQKKFRVEQETVDAGVVLAGREAEAVFVFHNDGDKPVNILKAKPT